MEKNLKELIRDRDKLGDARAYNIAKFVKILLGNNCNMANSIHGENLLKEVNKLSHTEKVILINHYGLNGQEPKKITDFYEAVKVGIYHSPREIIAIEAVAFSKLRQGVIMSHYYEQTILS